MELLSGKLGHSRLTPYWAFFALTPRLIVFGSFGAFVFAIFQPSILAAQTPDSSAPANAITGITAAQLFEIANRATGANDFSTAETIYQALIKDPDADVRAEARFRLSQLLQSQKRYSDAAVLLRALLDEKPDAQRVRLELAKVLALMGDERGAYRALRQAQAGGLPPEVAVLVSQFANAFRANKPFGFSVEFALAPDSNINRATNSDTLDTIIAPLQLSEDAQQQSGTGVKLGAQAFARIPVGNDLNIASRVSGQASLYGAKQFNDVAGSAQLGLEWTKGRSRYIPAIGRTYRWYGGKLYAVTNTASINWRRRLGQKAQMDADIAIGRSRYKLNNLQNGTLYNASLSYERAFNARSGGSVTVSGQRQTATDAGYATASGGLGLLYWREIGKVTVFATADARRLEADARLLLFPKRRQETYGRVSLGATFRQIQISGFSPLLRASYERNNSSIGLYDYDRKAIEVGISRAF
jgi:outer membrane protein